MNSQLTVYKASAGSGKTFTLTREYMTLVIENPRAYRTILAVTFTNKATEEMKLRILSQLYGIAHHLSESEGYMIQIQQALPHFSEEQIRKNADEALHLLIHNYNYFRVETIDTFFQSVLRNLARELDLTANLRIGLNDYQVEQQAVDELIESLENTDRLLFWIMDYIKENMADDKSWNVIGQIKKFGENIFKDFYKDNAEALNQCLEQENFFKDFSAKMRSIKNKAQGQMEEIAATFFDALEEGGFSADDLNLKTKGIWSYFNKLKQGKYNDEDLLNATFCKCYESPEAWVKKTDVKRGTPIFQCVSETLYPLLRFTEENRPKLLRMYKSADLTVRHLNQLRLLGSIDKKVREMNQEANRFLLSDTQTLLHALVQDTDSPFVFEKIGTQLDHVMIDEFQDTSTIQWKNFKVLLEETMSRENAGNLIVGDVKQSIYRWRSGDWRLLNNIERQFAEGTKTLDIKTLDTNYRSDKNVVDFNNAFFTEAAKLEAENLQDSNPEEVAQLVNAYADVCQKVPSKKINTGLVDIRLLGGDDTTERMMHQTLDTVRKLEEMGVPYNKMAILVRSNRIIQNIASYFMENSNYPMVSDEAFRLDASQAVCLLVTTLRYLAHPNDEISCAVIRKYIQVTTEEKAEANSEENGVTNMEAFEQMRDYLLQLPLYDLIENLYSFFRMGDVDAMKQQSAYISTFYDQLNAYLAENSSDIESFLAEWDNSIHEKSIHCDAVDGIRLITIHKSKGLEFDHVIMPFCDWKMEQGGTIWCEPQEKPYSDLPLVPVDYGQKQMSKSIYEPDFHHEHLQNVVDNLNLLYVAFTRASHSLFVLGKRGNVSMRSNVIELVMEQVAKDLEQNGTTCQLEGIGGDSQKGNFIFKYGELAPSQTEENKKLSKNVFMAKEKSIDVSIQVKTEIPEFRQSNKSRDLIIGDEEEEQQKYYIKMGVVLHNVFSTIRTTADIDKALKQMELDGVIYDDNVSRQRIEDMIRKRLASPKVKDWFSSRWTVVNECNIVSPVDGRPVKEHRPDRVMKDGNETIVVDFKFGKPHSEYQEQVREYMKLLCQLGCPNVKGYLWYVYPNKVEEVNL